MTSIKSISLSAAAALLLATAMIGSASAQNQPSQQNSGASGPGMMGWGYMSSGMMGPGMMGNGGAGMMGSSGWGQASWGQAMCGAMAGHVDGRLAYIKTELKITSAQETLWNAYADAARGKANTMLARCTTMMSQRDAKVSLPDRLDQNEQLMAAQLEAVRATNKAFKPLYESFSDSQKKSADQLFWGPMGMMGMGMM